MKVKEREGRRAGGLDISCPEGGRGGLRNKINLKIPGVVLGPEGGGGGGGEEAALIKSSNLSRRLRIYYSTSWPLETE